MHTEDVCSLSEFIGHTDSSDLVWGSRLFRGQSRQGNLVPSIARSDTAVDTTEREKEVLEQLRLLGASMLPDKDSSALELLVLAQHFGLKTRLLDWTTNPLTALWFACTSRQDGDVFVYALNPDELLFKNVYSSDPFAISGTRVFQPRLNNARIIAQHGWFTLHCYSSKAKRFVPLDEDPQSENNLVEVRVPAARRGDIRVSLERHGISNRTLFPDLEGLCRDLNWSHHEA